MRFGLNLKNFKKIHEDNNKAVLMHDSGHHFVIDKTKLDGKLRSQLSQLPIKMADGGDVENASQMPAQDDLSDVENTPVTTPDEQQQDPGLLDSVGNAIGNFLNYGSDENIAKRKADLAAQEQANGMAPNVDENAITYPSEDVNRMPAQEGATPQSQYQDVGIPDPSQYYGKALGEAKQGLQQQYNADVESAKLQQQQAQNEQQMMQKFMQDHQTNLQSYLQDRDKILDEMKNNVIDPNRYVNNMSTGSKIASAIGMIAGGLGSAFTGGPNPAMKFLNDQIERDVAAQRANMQNKGNLLAALDSKYRNITDSENMLRSIYAGNIAAKMRENAAKTAEPMAKARLLQAAGQLDAQYAQPLSQMAFQKTMIQHLQNPNGGFQPEEAVPYLIKDPTIQTKAFQEIKDAKNVVKLAPQIMQAFDQASKASLSKATPGLESAGQKAFSALINTTVTGLEGTARQAAFESIMRNLRPQFGDSPSTLASKRQATINYLMSKTAAPVSRGYHIDLNRFPETSYDRLRQELQQSGPQQIAHFNGVPYVKVQGGWKRVQ